MKNIVSLIVISCLFVNCKKDKLSLKSDQSGLPLKSNGYYYRNVDYGFETYFMFLDGVTLYSGFLTNNNLAELDLSVKEKFIDNSNYKKSSFNWGIFKVEQNTIKIERRLAEEKLPVQTYIGTILNDTTFVLQETYRLKRGKKKDYSNIDRTFHFRSFSQKPDSTNKFIK